MSNLVPDIRSGSDGNEINVLEFMYALVKHKFLIVGMTVIGIAGGYIGALYNGPTWVAEVVIAPKETEAKQVPSLSSFGAFGGLVSSQLNIGGDASLEKIDQLLNSRDFNARMIERYDLLPVLYQYNWPKVYAAQWDSSVNGWKETFTEPSALKMGNFLKGRFLEKKIKDNMMTIEVRSKDSLVSSKLLDYYVSFLDEDIKASILDEAKENVDFLNRQLISIADPLLREKIQALIADEIEKTMLVSKEAFKIIDPVYLSRKFKEKKLFPLLFGFLLFAISVAITVVMHAFKNAQKSDEDKALITEIKKALLYPVGNDRQ